jgi:phosphonate transport system substrate-binding protein
MTKLRFKTFLAPNMWPVYAFIVEAVGVRLGIETELAVGRSFDEFARGEAEAGFLCGLPYVQLARRAPGLLEPLVAPVLHGERFAGRPIYFSDVIVHRDAPFARFEDLRGRTWAYNDPDSHSGYNLTRATMVQRGLTGGFFGRVVQAGFHQKCLELVANGEVDGAAIDCQVLMIELRERPDLAERVKVIDSFGPSTTPPVVALGRLPATLRAELRAALLELGADPRAREVLAFGFIERFAPVSALTAVSALTVVGDCDYDDIRRMLAACEQAGFMTIR